MKKLFVSTYGCQMNVRDAEEVTGLLMAKGYALTDSTDEADVLLYNTCSVREHAENKVWSELGRVRAMKASRPELIVGVMGCMAKAQRETIFKRMPHVDFISAPAQLYDVPQLVASIEEERRPMAAIQEKRRAEFQSISYHTGAVTALVTVMEGCDKVCAYCIVPYTRGPEVSRPPEQVIGEVEELARRGYKEVTLLGQNVNSYGRRFPGENGAAGRREARDAGFPDLLRRLNQVDGIRRIRFITSHPWDALEGLFSAMRDLDRVCEHLHLPVQSGSGAVLQRMRRGYTSGEYLDKLRMLRQRVPDVAVTTDLMVGFPGETEEDFEATLRLVEQARFDSAFIFTYSPRPFAASSKWEDDVPEEVKGSRLQTLLALQGRISREAAEAWIGREAEVLVEEPGMGRTRNNRKAYFEQAGAKPGDILRIRVNDVRGQSFLGKVLGMGLLALALFAAPTLAAEDLASIQGAFLRGEYETVVRETGHGLKDGAAEDEMLYLRGVSAVKLRDWELARTALGRLVEKHPSSRLAPHGWLALGDAWAGAGQPEKALELYSRAIREGRAAHLAPQVLFRQGLMQRELGLWEEARASFDQVLKAAPDSPEAALAQQVLRSEDFFFCVQVGSFITRSNAVKLANELKKRGYPAEVSEALMNGKTFHRVRIGRFSKRAEADSEARRLAGDGFPARVFP